MYRIAVLFGLSLLLMLPSKADQAFCPQGLVMDPLHRCVCPTGRLTEWELVRQGSSGAEVCTALPFLGPDTHARGGTVTIVQLPGGGFISVPSDSDGNGGPIGGGGGPGCPGCGPNPTDGGGGGGGGCVAHGGGGGNCGVGLGRGGGNGTGNEGNGNGPKGGPKHEDHPHHDK